jgi:hypothetical protein
VIYAFGESELDEERFELRRADQVELQPNALELLSFPVRNRERALPEQELLEAVWPGTANTDNSLARGVDHVEPAISRKDPNPRRGDAGERPRRAPKGEPPPEPSDGDYDPTAPHIDVRV